MDWDDVRVFLAVARHGSLRAAGRALGLSQPTIGRRLAGFEATFGGPTLFDRLPEGLRLNAAGDALMPAAEELGALHWRSSGVARRLLRHSAVRCAFQSANGAAPSWLATSINRAKPGCRQP
jgi:DNA-binding transcriptional LysR family regulator